MSFTIRKSLERDLPAIDRLYGRSYPRLLKADYAPSVLVTVIPKFSKAQPRLVTSGTFYVAETHDWQIVGAGGWTPQGPMGEREAGTGHIRHFATDPDAVRLGIGRALMDGCINEAKDHGMTRLSCYSTLTAVPFYEALGFVPQNEIEIEMGAHIGFPAVWMIRDLN